MIMSAFATRIPKAVKTKGLKLYAQRYERGDRGGLVTGRRHRPLHAAEAPGGETLKRTFLFGLDRLTNLSVDSKLTCPV